jgi:hypothetical protein
MTAGTPLNLIFRDSLNSPPPDFIGSNPILPGYLLVSVAPASSLLVAPASGL